MTDRKKPPEDPQDQDERKPRRKKARLEAESLERRIMLSATWVDADTGQVLQIERSFGGSHNPHEMELARDLVRGTVVQLAATHAALAAPDPAAFQLFEATRRMVPEAWRGRLERFVSGALHDTCNVSAAVAESRAGKSSGLAQE